MSTQTVGEELCFWPAPNFLAKNRTKFECRPFSFFWSSPDSGQENRSDSVEKFSFWSLLFSNFLNFLLPPFPKSCVRYCLDHEKLRTHRRSQGGQGARDPNRNASNDNFGTKTAVDFSLTYLGWFSHKLQTVQTFFLVFTLFWDEISSSIPKDLF